MTSLKVRSSTSPLESDAVVLCVRERDRDLDRERARPNNGDRPTWNFNSTLDTFCRLTKKNMSKYVSTYHVQSLCALSVRRPSSGHLSWAGDGRGVSILRESERPLTHSRCVFTS